MPHSTNAILGKTYAQKLASEDWLRFSENVRRDRGNACECCRRTNVVTQVHHVFYEPGKEPWQSKQEDVILLCEVCHRGLHVELQEFRRVVFKGLSPQAFRVLNSALVIGIHQYDPLIFAHALSEFVKNKRLVENHAKAWGTTAEPKPKYNIDPVSKSANRELTKKEQRLAEYINREQKG